MKKLILSTALLVGFAASVLAQGYVCFDTSNNTSTSPTATTGGQWFEASGGGTVLLPTDVNAVLWGSTSATGPWTAVDTLLLSTTPPGTLAGGIGNFPAASDILFNGAGSFQDQSGRAVQVAGASGTAWFYITAWTGNFNTLGAALQAGGNYTYNGLTTAGGIFSNPVTASATQQPPVISDNPAIVLTVPEPGTFALAGLGAAALLIFRRRK